MPSALEQPKPCAGSKKPGLSTLLKPSPSEHHRPYANLLNARYQATRSLALPTPSPSPSRLPSASPASSSSMLSVCSPPDALDPVFRQLSISSMPMSNSSPLFESFASDDPVQNAHNSAPPSFKFSHDAGELERAPPFFGTSTNDTSAIVFNAFRLTKSRVLRVFNLPPSAQEARQAIASLYTAPQRVERSTSTQLFPSAADPPLPIRIWALREEYGGRRLGEEDSVWLVYQTHDEARAALALCDSASVTAALETDLEPFDKLRRYDMKAISSLHLLPARPMFPDQRLLSPTSPGPYPFPSGTESELLYSRADSLSKCQQGFHLSSNPPNPRSAFRNGDWICPSASCAAHNFSRNAICIGCGSSRASNAVQSPRSNEVPFPSTRLASPRFASTMPHQPLASSPSPTSLTFPNSVSQLATRHLPPPQLNTKLPPPQHPILTPSGRALAIGGKVQNVSSDPLTPVLMFWPDNEPFPEPGQVRPAGLANIHQPPIMNTGNKGPIEHQPGDWICQKCDYLNWRRRKVCQTCYPYAEGNGDSVSSTMQAERLALLATVLAQTQVAQLGLQSPLSVLQPHASNYQPLSAVAVNASPLFSSLQPQPQPQPPHRSSVPTSRPNLPTVNPRLANQAFARRSNSTPEMLTVGNIVYQTPTSPAASRHPPISPEKTPSQLGPLLPSFLKNEIKPTRARSPSSLSPSSPSSADLSFEECDDELNSPTRRMAAMNFYAQKNVGSGRLSNASGSTSSLTLGGSMGGSIWSFDRNEDKAWSSAVSHSPELLASARSRTTSFDALKAI